MFIHFRREVTKLEVMNMNVSEKFERAKFPPHLSVLFLRKRRREDKTRGQNLKL